MRRLVIAELYGILSALFFIALLVYGICKYTFVTILENFWWLGPLLIVAAWAVSCIGGSARPPRNTRRHYKDRRLR